MNLRDILRLSSSAVCGINEREIVVRKDRKAAVINSLKKAGYIIVGSGYAGTNTVKIWFAKGSLLF